MTGKPRKEWDYIIVGAGSAGCALAHELANRQPNATVLLLEAGGANRSPYIHLQATAFRACLRHDWGYRSQPDPSRNGATDRWWKGRVLGGTSSINSSIFVRGGRFDFDRWAAQLDPGSNHHGWAGQDVMPIFRDLETSDQSGASRGRSGPLYVRTVKKPHEITEAFINSARTAGHSFNPDYNDVTQEGVAYAQLSQRRGLRCSAADAFLRPILGSDSNVTLLLNANILKVTVENGRAVGVSLLQGDRVRHVQGARIILCAGAINSPKILMLSGIGDPQELQSHGIEVRVPLTEVGCNLKDHPLTRLLYRARIPTYNLTGGLLQKAQFARKFISCREGPIANIFEGVAFIRTAASEIVPDVQIHFVPLGYSHPDSSLILEPYPAVIVCINKSHSLSAGRVRLANADPLAPPLIESRLLSSAEDVETLVRGMTVARHIMKSRPIADLIETECDPGADIDSNSDLRAYVRNHTVPANHTIGTCRMGANADSVVGPDLKVHGIDNLWVADASIMPDHISGNTNATCMMIGKKLGRQLCA